MHIFNCIDNFLAIQRATVALAAVWVGFKEKSLGTPGIEDQAEFESTRCYFDAWPWAILFTRLCLYFFERDRCLKVGLKPMVHLKQ